MTLLNWELKDDGISLLSDTLCLDGNDRRPRMFMTKVFVLPHIYTMLTGTGIAPVISDFFIDIKEHVVATDIEHLDRYASQCLLRIWERYKAQADEEGGTVTIYTFGYMEETGTFTGFAYRSTNGFRSERLQPGLATKPAPNDRSVTSSVVDLSSWTDLCLLQQQEDRERPRLERVGIGGDLWLYNFVAVEGLPMLSQARVRRLPHFDEDWEIILAKLPENAGHPLSKLTLASDP